MIESDLKLVLMGGMMKPYKDLLDIFAFLKYYLEYKGNMSKIVARMDWQELYSFASKQALLGLCFKGIERLGKEYPEELKQNPIGRELLMNWMGSGATDSQTEYEGECCGG